MKTIKTTILVAILLLMNPFFLSAQDQMFWIHEDVIKPSMMSAYEASCKEFTDNLKKHDIPDIAMSVSNSVEGNYYWITPIDAMADIDKPMLNKLKEKMGAENMNGLFDRMDKSYDVHHDYILNLKSEFSYQPNGMELSSAGEDYRKWYRHYYTPADRSKMVEKIKAIKSIFEGKNSKLSYRIYESGFGNEGSYFLVSIPAKNAADYATKIEENNKLLGAEWQKAYEDFMGATLAFEVVDGRMRPDMGYTSK